MARIASARLTGELLHDGRGATWAETRTVLRSLGTAAQRLIRGEAACWLFVVLATAMVAQRAMGPARLNEAMASLTVPLFILGVVAMLALLSERNVRRQNGDETAAAQSPAEEAKPSRLSQITHSEIQLERRAQRLAELADTASRAAITAEADSAASAELFGRISHAMRTPLNAIIGFSDLMQKELFGPLGHARYQDYSAHIRDAGFDLLAATEDVLAITCLANRPAPSRCRDVEIDIPISQAIRAMIEQARSKGITLAHPEPNEIIALAEPRGLKQALINVLGEAMAQAPAGTRLVFDTAEAGDAVAITISAHGEATTGSKFDEGVPRGEDRTSLRLAIAEALLGLQSATLEIEEGADIASWHARIALPRSAARSPALSMVEPACA